jgi:hypothetical protein
VTCSSTAVGATIGGVSNFATSLATSLVGAGASSIVSLLVGQQMIERLDRIAGALYFGEPVPVEDKEQVDSEEPAESKLSMGTLSNWWY